MKSIKKIYLPETNSIILEAIRKCDNFTNVEILNHCDICLEWFQKENIDYSKFSEQQIILINSFLALKNKKIDALIVGLEYSSRDVFKWAIKILNFEKNILSSCFVVRDCEHLSIWGDCAFNIEPNHDVAVKNIQDMITMAYQLNLKPINVKLLSYSTNDSGAGIQIDFINKISQTLKLNYKNQEEVNISNNIQFDAAFNPIISNKKSIEYLIPNVVWFPNLMSGNIGYKIAQHYGKLIFAGPFILGLNYFVSDLSRGASVDDVVLTIETMAKMVQHN